MLDKNIEKIKKTTEELKDQCLNALVDNVKDSLVAFSKIPEKDQIKEFGQGRTAIACCDNICDIIQKMSSEEMRKAEEVFPQFRTIAMNCLTYLELGLTFGYTAKKSDK